MIAPITNRPNLPIKPTAPVRKRSPRLEVELDATIESDGIEHPAQIRDLSTTGAAIFGSPPKLSNDMFIELHLEGQRSLKANVVREFQGGYAVQFDGTKNAVSAEQLSAFQNAAQGGL